MDRQLVSNVKTDAVQTFESPPVATRPTSGIQTSTTDRTSQAECLPHVCRRGGGMLRYTSQNIPNSRSCTLTSTSTVTESFDEPYYHHGTETAQPTSRSDEFEIEFDDPNEPFSDSANPDRDQTSAADELDTAYQDLNEPSSDSEAPEQTSDGTEHEFEIAYQYLNEPFSDSEDQDQANDGADQLDDPPSELAGDEADEFVHDQLEEQAYDSDQFEGQAYESGRSEHPASGETDNDADAFDEPSSNDEEPEEDSSGADE